LKDRAPKGMRQIRRKKQLMIDAVIKKNDGWNEGGVVLEGEKL